MDKIPHNVKQIPATHDEQKPYGGGSVPSNYKKPMSPTQIAWRLGLFILGAIVGALIANL